MLLETPPSGNDYELLDTGDGQRLEKWGPFILSRPDPQIIWSKNLAANQWQAADAVFISGKGEDKGRWNIKNPIPEKWEVEMGSIKLYSRLTPFKHTGIFAEQAAQWNWMYNKLKSETGKLKVLNLFAYTGGATMALAKQGCFVTHVDASKPSILLAKENQALNKLPQDSIRWILDDAAKFVSRELKRGQNYDGIVLDPPAFGHSPSGKTWKFNRDLPKLLRDCVRLLSGNARFLLINGYATNSWALALNNIMEETTQNLKGNVEFGELCLKQKSGQMISTGIFARWSR